MCWLQQRGVKSAVEMADELRKLSSTQDKLDWLREQIEMRVMGLCWVEFRAHWSSSTDEVVGTVQDLTGLSLAMRTHPPTHRRSPASSTIFSRCDDAVGHLEDILEEEQVRDIPAHAPAPIMQRKTFKQLGTLTVQATQLANQRLSLSSEVTVNLGIAQ